MAGTAPRDSLEDVESIMYKSATKGGMKYLTVSYPALRALHRQLPFDDPPTEIRECVRSALAKVATLRNLLSPLADIGTSMAANARDTRALRVLAVASSELREHTHLSVEAALCRYARATHQCASQMSHVDEMKIRYGARCEPLPVR